MRIHNKLLSGFAFFAVLLLAAGCTSPEGGETLPAKVPGEVPPIGANDTGIGGDGEVSPPAGMNATGPECTYSNRTVEAYSSYYGERASVVEEICDNVSWTFDPPILAAEKIRREGGVEYKFNRINLSGSSVVFAVLNETAVVVGKEREHMFMNHYPGCGEQWGEGGGGTFTLGGMDYGYRRVLSLDAYGAMFEDVDQARNFTLAFGELYDSGDGIVFLWKTAPGTQICASWAEISVFEKALIINVRESGGEATIILSEEENVQEGPIYEYPGSVFEDEIRLAYVSVPGDLVE